LVISDIGMISSQNIYLYLLIDSIQADRTQESESRIACEHASNILLTY